MRIRPPRHRGAISAGNADHGYSLLAVLWMMSLAALIVLAIQQLVLGFRGDVTATAEGPATDRVAEAAILQLMKSEIIGEDGSLNLAGSIIMLGEPVTFLVNFENGLINLNRAAEDLIAAAFLTAGVEEEVAVRLARNVIDWRDADDVRAGSGDNEQAHYEALGRAYGPRNGPMASVGELAYVEEMTPALYECVRPLFTVASATGAVALSRAPDGVKSVFRNARSRAWLGRSWPDPDDLRNDPLSTEALNGRVLRIQMAIGQGPPILRNAVVRYKSAADRSFDYIRGPHTARAPEAQESCPFG